MIDPKNQIFYVNNVFIETYPSKDRTTGLLSHFVKIAADLVLQLSVPAVQNSEEIRIPVLVSKNSVGISLFLQQVDYRLQVKGYNEKRIRDIFIPFYGGSVGAGAQVYGQGQLVMNRAGIYLVGGNILRQSYGVDFSMLTIELDTLAPEAAEILEHWMMSLYPESMAEAAIPSFSCQSLLK